jgi:hypothetical protein
MIHGHLPSTDAVLAAQDTQHDGIDADEVAEVQPVRGVEKMPVGTRIEHGGKMWEVVFDADGKDCDGCAACCDFDLCYKLYSCKAGGRDDGLDVVMREVVG